MPSSVGPAAPACAAAQILNKTQQTVKTMNTYQITNIGAGSMWRVIDRSKGGKVVGFGSTYAAAAAKAQELEAKLNGYIEYLIESRKAA